MAHTYYHCGTAGESTGEREITIYTGSVLNYAVALFPEGLREYGIPEYAIDDLAHFIWCQRQELVEKLLHMGIPYTYHVPHAGNLDPHD